MGIIRALFGGNNQGQSAFYLSEDDAKTMGDIDYMRSNKVIRHTFAKKKGETGEKASTKSISAMKSTQLGENGLPSTPPATNTFGQSTSSTFGQSASFAQSSETFGQSASFAQSSEAESKPTERRSASVDSSMDMFRNMAKQIRK
ncbi:MAG: hypothetical protein AAF921_12925 [Cyanobacteria bacterium P01_D01_bin.44]